MLRAISLCLVLFLIAGAGAAQAATKKLTAGAGVYVVTTEEDDERENMEGHAFTAAMALGPGSAVRGHLYFTKHEDNDAYELEGFDAQFMLGSNLNRTGFKIYVLGGYWQETMSVEGTSAKPSLAEVDFSGYMAGLGIGYNWPSAALDFWAAWRDPSEYKDYYKGLFGEEPDINMGAGALTFGLRF